ncbi:hypothetical protein J7W19_13450 [Streptomyces mobaraensis NBRC 13819 = DSM 40847]|uniref:Uncharacterized protein n=1 Tax=Streptomyces mobaraensis (strain ATCC 29032 / DSM 40847 / JCM 4168 / NBRC 13819 / NCIMB 11159 / IPCR 16-22) TaxID=1223523 RepID=M3AV63_STRM1|nr:hypothetical protein [Streptomyces mobaraensis]EME97472.1 hypothetical protein H340_26354 [Streptomyces mobaraensis NBRC 13819 = DSM 40847]QTT74275.1 hypothetical protein J7W19_13450 [Streptomyces mobaraensis NBRC 13819 = DSM 40847]
MHLPRLALWCGAAVAFVLAVVAYAAHAFWALALCAALGTVLAGTAEAYADRRRRRDWYTRTFASFDELRAAVDAPALRRIRDERGVAAAVRAVRGTYPSLPLAEAARLVKTL